jgi:hypothetical protein
LRGPALKEAVCVYHACAPRKGAGRSLHGARGSSHHMYRISALNSRFAYSRSLPKSAPDMQRHPVIHDTCRTGQRPCQYARHSAIQVSHAFPLPAPSVPLPACCWFLVPYLLVPYHARNNAALLCPAALLVTTCQRTLAIDRPTTHLSFCPTLRCSLRSVCSHTPHEPTSPAVARHHGWTRSQLPEA